MEKNKKKRKKEAVCDVCCKFRARRNKVTHCLTSGVQPKLFKCLCSNSFWLRPFRGSLWQVTSSSYIFKQEANLSLAVLPFFDIAIVGRGNATPCERKGIQITTHGPLHARSLNFPVRLLCLSCSGRGFKSVKGQGKKIRLKLIFVQKSLF